MKTLPMLACLTALFASPAILAAEPDTNGGCRSCCAPMSAAPGASLTDKSVYQLDDSWKDDIGQTKKLASLRGRPQIVLMFFASCPYACPLLVSQVKQIEAALPESVRSGVGFTLVSFDTERDTPEALHAYRARHELPLDRWTLLHGDADAVLDLAALLGVKFKKDASGGFSHSNLVTLLNADGEIAYQQTGLNTDPQEMVRHIEQLISAKRCHP